MDEVNINKYLSQFNPILIVPVLSAVVGAILVFVFGFKRPNEPRFQSNSSIDSLKKSKRKANTAKSSDAVQTSKQQNVPSSSKVSTGKKVTQDTTNATTGKKTSNNNNSINSNNNISKKKTDEKKSENTSPAKKLVSKKSGKESAVATNKKSKANNNSFEGGHDEKPADFDDGDWFTVQSKGKQKNKADDVSGNQAENVSPKVQATKNSKQAKAAKAEVKPQLTTSPVTTNELNNGSNDLQQSFFESNEETNIELESNDNPLNTEKPAIAHEEPIVVAASDIVEVVVEKRASAPVATEAVEVNVIADNAIVFDELGEWTDAKPDRKRGNKKKSRKD